MCEYLMLGVLPSQVEPLRERLEGICRVGRFSCPPVEEVLSEGRILVTVTDGACSCGLFVEPGEDEAHFAALDRRREKNLRRKCERRGWPEARIRRVLEESANARNRPDLQPAIERQKRIEDAITEVASRESAGVELLLHRFSGSLGHEDFTVRTPPERWLRASLRPSMLERDRLYRVKPS